MIPYAGHKQYRDDGMLRETGGPDRGDRSGGRFGDAVGDFHSVEFSVNGLNVLYQSKLWNNSTSSMFALVKENSDILQWIHVGDVLNMKYYTRDSLCPTRNFDTKIDYIIKDMEGRFKGHYLVGLEIQSERYPSIRAA